MTTDIEKIGESGLRFFGKVTASISHEINNVLAIINENAGLLEDYILMAEKGMSADLKKFKLLSEKITAQVRRADTIIGNMNRFSHSVDISIRNIDLCDLLGLMMALAQRLVDMRGITLELEKPSVPICISTNEFLLENLLWQCLDFSMDVSGHEKTVFLSAAEMEGKAMIRFSGLSEMACAVEKEMPVWAEKNGLLDALKGELVTDVKKKAFMIKLPHDIHL